VGLLGHSGWASSGCLALPLKPAIKKSARLFEDGLCSTPQPISSGMVSHLKSQTLDESVGILPGVDGLQRTRQDISCSWPVDREAMDGHPDGEEEALETRMPW
jgi:hypothetical protein